MSANLETEPCLLVNDYVSFFLGPVIWSIIMINPDLIHLHLLLQCHDVYTNKINAVVFETLDKIIYNYKTYPF